jgi:5-methylcytosine-specific restriction endonuclease McrA
MSELPSCPVCSAPVQKTVRPGNRGGRQRVYCSKKCSDLASWRKRSADTKNPVRVIHCQVCAVEFGTSFKKQKFCSASCRYEFNLLSSSAKWREQNPRPEMFVYDCDWCHAKIERPMPLGGHKRYHQECAKQAQAARYRAKNTVRQSKTAKPSRVVIEHLVAAYGAVCYLCSEPVDLDIPRTSRMGATVDHIVPLAKGGSDEFENLQLAHWICNNRKSDKLIEGLNA